MSDVLTRLAEIRQRQGLPPINPSIIQGFGPEEPPPPDEPNPDNESFPEDEDDLRAPLPPAAAPEVPASPLVNLGRQATPPAANLLVLDSMAAYQGQKIKLTEKEQGQVVRIVLLAVRRQLKEQLAALDRRLPRRARRATSISARNFGAPAGTSISTATPPTTPTVARVKRKYVRRKTALKS
ncbi:MAG: hypothetical protein A2Z30_03345 [Chloroflexi bacterium RBG_16_64_43]|nr:MAG: hypothetical protein A2Z30_03345 [Chloroflexi bacterium RBG_16_64_43]